MQIRDVKFYENMNLLKPIVYHFSDSNLEINSPMMKLIEEFECILHHFGNYS